MKKPEECEEELWEGKLLSRTIHVRLDAAMYRQLVRYCKRKGLPASIVVRNLIKDFLDPGIE